MARISPGTMTAAVFAILIGLAGAYSVRQYLEQPPVAEEQAEQDEPSAVRVPLAGNDLMAGRKLTINDVIVIRMSPEKYEKSDYKDKQFMRDPSQIAGRVLREPISKGDVFLTTDLYPEGMGPGVSEMLEPGYRAVSVPIHNIAAVAGFARPGSIVDVLFRATGNEKHPEMTMTLIERAEVLAVGETMLPDHDVDVGEDSKTGNVTLAVASNQAKILKAVEDRGELTLTLRSPEETVNFVPRGSAQRKVTMPQLLGLPTVRQQKTLDIYRGAEKSTMTFEQEVPVERDFGPVIDTPVAADVPARGPLEQQTSQAGPERDEGSATAAQTDGRIPMPISVPRASNEGS